MPLDANRQLFDAKFEAAQGHQEKTKQPSDNFHSVL
jgi:hypothetical protein